MHESTERYLTFMAPTEEKRQQVRAIFDVNRPPPKRERKPNGSSGQPLEADTLRAVSELLATHPKVLFAVRQNSGAMQYQNAGGRSVPVWFYKWTKRAAKMRISDHWGLLTDGRMFALESKRPGWRGPSDLREFEQLEFINTVKAAGGIGGFVTSAEEALALLP